VNAPRFAIVVVAAAVACALGFAAALVPGRSLGEVPSEGAVQVAGEISSEPAQLLADGTRCAAIAHVGLPRRMNFPTGPDRLTTCYGETWRNVSFTDANGQHATLASPMVWSLGEKLANRRDGVVHRAASDCPMFFSAFEACIPQGLRVVVRACRSGTELVPCRDGHDDIWSYTDVPFSKRMVDRRRLVWAACIIALIAGLAAGALRLLRRAR
jgi:hypothetical protein